MFLFTQPIDKKAIEQAISLLEKQTSAELRVYIERKMPKAQSSSIERAKALFTELEMEKTAQRNGVLIYVALQSKQCAVIGDQGIDQYVAASFWQQACDLIVAGAKQKQHTTGIVNAIRLIADCLAQHFPYQADDRNELPNDVVIK
ncbi:membrane protein [Gallibacterium salpingitidis]|uniref:Membrane protein n=1 Tax=Gallibacterium salpingitidis TaxID=505341 RepID=A0A1A7Q210_9PAST|nr:TPM domain-containing protein [Gallibacterium salpingitidis]OBW96328.1 membrane protein [Gallibacterium salpingitidis]OBX07967.1 membrane protein [Gallibacterium salpingitidis]